ncbi:MAG TPA: hypothetical protein VMT37_13375 [Solirubrobacterales bacterium]|nr:hypothetical protein [Solirubrobacterales bacterium]
MAASKRRRRGLRLAVAGALALVAGLLVFAAVQGDDDGGGGPLNAIAAAAVRTQDEHGGRVVMHVVVSPQDRSGSFTITGRGVFNAEGRDRTVLTIPASAPNGPGELEGITDGTVIYLRSSEFGSLPGGAKWMSIDLSLGDELNSQLPANGDPKGELALLEAATGGVQKLGEEDVRGVPTTRYRGEVSPSENVERLREEGADDLASVVEKKAVPVQIEAWVDGKGLVRRMRVVQPHGPGQGGKGSTGVDMRIDFFDFGIQPAIETPPQSEVFDATGQVKEELGISGGG